MKRAASLRLHKYRLQHKAFLTEGADLLAAGLASGHAPQAIFVLEGSGAERELTHLAAGARSALPVTLVTRRVAERISTMETPAAVMAVFPMWDPPPLASLAAPALLAVYADHISDPGNLGTLIRAAAAFGAACLLTSPGSVDPWSPKVARASMGSLFSLPVYAGRLLRQSLAELTPARAYGLVAHGGADLSAAKLDRPAVVCVGSERAGLAADVEALVHAHLTIPLPGEAAGVESLNAGVAGAIALYEFSRRTGHTTTSER